MLGLIFEDEVISFLHSHLKTTEEITCGEKTASGNVNRIISLTVAWWYCLGGWQNYCQDQFLFYIVKQHFSLLA